MRAGIQRRVFIIIAVLLLGALGQVRAQLDSCDISVPYYFVDLTGDPAGTWISPLHGRNANCCGTGSPDNCTSFEVLLDTLAAALSFNIFSGAIPSGSMFFQIDCGPPTAVGELICISGAGPHRITFCKPGGNENEYVITSIPKPTFPLDDSTRSGCSKPLEVLGFEPSTITWNTVSPGSYGEYNHLLSNTDSSAITMFTPDTNGITTYEIEVCGFPQADECGYILTLCDTVLLEIANTLEGNVSPNPGTYCQAGPGSGVTLSASAIGGNGEYSYIWIDSSGATVSTSSTYFAETQQAFSVEVNDGLSSATCAADYISVPVVETSIPVVDAGIDQFLCPTAPDAILNGSVIFATGGYWSGGNGTYSPDSASLFTKYTPTAAEIASGTLVLILNSTGAGGSCPDISDSLTLIYPDTIKITLSDTTVSCFGDLANLSPAISGGIAPYTYLWNIGDNSPSINVGPGTYCLTVVDALGCSMQQCSNVNSPTVLTSSISSTAATTDGGSDGTATINPVGGIPPYTYSWLPSGSSQTETGLGYGVYTVTVTDNNGCTTSGSVVVNEPRCAGYSASASATPLSCYADTNSTATVNLVGGSFPFTYQWNDPKTQTTVTATGLSAGVYIIVVEDANLCFAVAAATVTEPNKLINNMSWTNTNSVGASDGTATANPVGGSSPYTYSWSTSDSTQGITGLNAGSYSTIVSDTNGCFIIDSVMINEPRCTNMMVYVSGSNVSCKSGTDGDAEVYVIGGTTPYNILWSTSDTNNTIIGLGAGTYFVTVTDQKNCSPFTSISITEPSPLSTGIVNADISCFGSKDGTADLTVSGGTYPYTYLWSNSESAEDQVFMYPDTYVVTVTDNNSCVKLDSVEIYEPAPLSTSYTMQNVTCFAGNDAFIDLSITGGSNPISYLWSTGAISEDLDSLTAGLYWVIVTDVNGCQEKAYINILINEPEVVSMDSSYVACPVVATGLALATVFPAGGSGPYQVSFDSGLTYLTEGDYDDTLALDSVYFIIIRDTNNCSTTLADSISINPMTVIDSVVFETCFATGTTTTLLEVYPNGGDGGPYSISFDSGATFGALGDLDTNLSIGNTYQIVAMDSSGCVSMNLSATIPDLLVNSTTIISDYNGKDVSCAGSNDGMAVANTIGGTLPYIYEWSDGQSADTAISLGTGVYWVKVSDGLACADTAYLTINEPDTMVANANILSFYNSYHISCSGDTNGAVDLTVNGGTLPYIYSWSNGESSEDLTGIGKSVV